MCGNGNRAQRFLRRNLKTGTKKIEVLTYLTLVCPILDYATTVWDPYKKYTDKIEEDKKCREVQRGLPSVNEAGKTQLAHQKTGGKRPGSHPSADLWQSESSMWIVIIYSN